MKLSEEDKTILGMTGSIGLVVTLFVYMVPMFEGLDIAVFLFLFLLGMTESEKQGQTWFTGTLKYDNRGE